MFDWIEKSVIDMTLTDELKKAVCIVGTLALIALIGWIVDRLEGGEK